MDASSLLVMVVVVDVPILVAVYLSLKCTPIDRRVLLPVAGGLAGFVFQAFLCFGGVLLINQLALIAIIFGLVFAFSQRGRQR